MARVHGACRIHRDRRSRIRGDRRKPRASGGVLWWGQKVSAALARPCPGGHSSGGHCWEGQTRFPQPNRSDYRWGYTWSRDGPERVQIRGIPTQRPNNPQRKHGRKWTDQRGPGYQSQWGSQSCTHVPGGLRPHSSKRGGQLAWQGPQGPQTPAPSHAPAGTIQPETAGLGPS